MGVLPEEHPLNSAANKDVNRHVSCVLHDYEEEQRRELNNRPVIGHSSDESSTADSKLTRILFPIGAVSNTDQFLFYLLHQTLNQGSLDHVSDSMAATDALTRL